MPAKLEFSDEELENIIGADKKYQRDRLSFVRRSLDSGFCFNMAEIKEKIKSECKVTDKQYELIISSYTKTLEAIFDNIDYSKVSEKDSVYIPGFGRFKWRMLSIKKLDLHGKYGIKGDYKLKKEYIEERQKKKEARRIIMERRAQCKKKQKDSK